MFGFGFFKKKNKGKKPKNYKTIKELDLTHHNLTSIPDWLSECSSLKKLNLSFNKLSSLSGNLPPSLIELICTNNKITEIQQLPPNLRILWIDNNWLATIPANFPPNLNYLSIENNLFPKDYDFTLYQFQVVFA